MSVGREARRRAVVGHHGNSEAAGEKPRPHDPAAHCVDRGHDRTLLGGQRDVSRLARVCAGDARKARVDTFDRKPVGPRVGGQHGAEDEHQSGENAGESCLHAPDYGRGRPGGPRQMIQTQPFQ